MSLFSTFPYLHCPYHMCGCTTSSYFLLCPLISPLSPFSVPSVHTYFSLTCLCSRTHPSPHTPLYAFSIYLLSPHLSSFFLPTTKTLYISTQVSYLPTYHFSSLFLSLPHSLHLAARTPSLIPPSPSIPSIPIIQDSGGGKMKCLSIYLNPELSLSHSLPPQEKKKASWSLMMTEKRNLQI